MGFWYSSQVLATKAPTSLCVCAASAESYRSSHSQSMKVDSDLLNMSRQLGGLFEAFSHQNIIYWLMSCLRNETEMVLIPLI